MPAIQGSSDKMFFENAHIQHPRQYHKFFLRSRPYRGELPAIAGLLLYPDTPARMETTSQEAFCFRPAPQQHRGDCTTQRSQQDSLHPHPTSSRQTKGKGNSSRSRRPKEDEEEVDHHHTRTPAGNNPAEMKSQYQKDFPAPSSNCRRPTPALPQPDNIGINPAFRIEFSTVQREAFPGWPITTPQRPGRLRASCRKLQQK